jgi:hypothetical protein
LQNGAEGDGIKTIAFLSIGLFVMKIHFASCFAILVVGQIGTCAEQTPVEKLAREALEKSDQWTLLSLDPKEDRAQYWEMFISTRIVPRQLRFLTPYPQGDFHNWKILGEMTVTNRTIREALARDLFDGIAAKKEIDKYGPDFFMLARVAGPVVYEMQTEKRLTATGCFEPRHGIRVEYRGRRIELLICFQCSEVWFYIDAKREATAFTTAWPRSKFNAVLKEAKVPYKPVIDRKQK